MNILTLIVKFHIFILGNLVKLFILLLPPSWHYYARDVARVWAYKYHRPKIKVCSLLWAFGEITGYKNWIYLILGTKKIQ